LAGEGFGEGRLFREGEGGLGFEGFFERVALREDGLGGGLFFESAPEGADEDEWPLTGYRPEGPAVFDADESWLSRVLEFELGFEDKSRFRDSIFSPLYESWARRGLDFPPGLGPSREEVDLEDAEMYEAARLFEDDFRPLF
jgi:hypothetical protein